MTIYEFDRYINGRLMAEGVTIEKAKTLDAATAAAARIASKGPKGEAPVLVLRREPAAIEAPDAIALVAAAYRDAADRCGAHSYSNNYFVSKALHDASTDILSRTPADAQAALTAIERAAYERGKAETQQSLGVAVKETIIGVLRHYQQTEVCDEDGNGYPLVDALTLEGHSIDMGIREIENIADAVAGALLTQEGR